MTTHVSTIMAMDNATDIIETESLESHLIHFILHGVHVLFTLVCFILTIIYVKRFYVRIRKLPSLPPTSNRATSFERALADPSHPINSTESEYLAPNV